MANIGPHITRQRNSAPAPVTATEVPVQAESSSPAASPVDSLPRQQGMPLGGTLRQQPVAVTAVLLGTQVVGALVGATTASAAEPSDSTSSLDTVDAAADLERSGLTGADLDAARSALWSTYVAATTTTPTDTTTTPADGDFETQWAAAKKNSVGSSEVRAALAELGDGATTEKLFELLENFDKPLNKAGKLELQTAITLQSITSAASDNKLTVEELQTIEHTMAASFGDKAAQSALVRAAPMAYKSLDTGAAEHLLQRATSIDTHVARFQSIVSEMLDGKTKLFDLDLDGKLDSTDLVFKTGADGDVSISEVGKKVANEATVAKAIIDASYALNSSSIGFELIKNHRANPDFWDVGARGVLTPKEGVKPSDAVKDIIENSDKYGFECATGLVVVYYEAMLDLLGPKDFDRVASDLRIGPWEMERDLDRVFVTGAAERGSTYRTLSDDYKIKPGEYYYFKNWDVTDEAKARGWQGENVIYLGEGKYYGHGIGLGDADKFISKLTAEAAEDGKTPSLLNLHGWIDTDILKMDEHPGE